MSHLSLDDVRNLVAENKPITGMTLYRGSDESVASWQVYYVTGVSEVGMICVRNPWGNGGGAELMELELTEEEFNMTFLITSSGNYGEVNDVAV